MEKVAVSVVHQPVDASPLFTPFRVGRLTLDNRFVMAPMGRSSAQDGVLSPAYAPYYARRAAGGAALIIGEATAVDHPTAMHMHTSSTIHGRGADAWATEIGSASPRQTDSTNASISLAAGTLPTTLHTRRTPHPPPNPPQTTP